MSDLSAKPTSAIHVCIDMQRLFSAQGRWATLRMERAPPARLANARFREEARAAHPDFFEEAGEPARAPRREARA